MPRFLHAQNIAPCCWVGIKGAAPKEPVDGALVVECNYEEVVPAKAPGVSAPFLTASWDIECFSMTGDFPIPKRTWAKAVKDLSKLANDADEAVRLLVQSLSTGQTAVETLPAGMTPIYCGLKKPREMVQGNYGRTWRALVVC